MNNIKQPSPRAPLDSHLIYRILRMLIMGVCVGCVASLLTIGFVSLIDWLFYSAFGANSLLNLSNLGWLTIFVPAVGGLLVGYLCLHVLDKKPSTVANLIENVQGRREPITLKNGFLNALASLISLSSGASVGQYGPLAQMGAMVGFQITRLTRLESGIGVGCGVAAAIATAFSAPIAGIIFVHEVVLRHYSLRAFAPITVASSVGYFINTYVFGRPHLFELDVARSLFAPEIISFVAIGIGGALLAVGFMKLILCVTDYADKMSIHPVLKPALAGLAIGLVAQSVPEILGIGNETLSAVLSGSAGSSSQIALILLLKIAATVLCIGFGFAGGVFSPALLIGTLFGALAGQGAELLYGDSGSGMAFYAVCGMVAVTSPVIGAPLTIILIVFELTRNYELTTAVMISVVFSNVVSYRLFGRSLFDKQLALRGFDLSVGRDKIVLDQASIKDYISTNHVKGSLDSTLDELKQALMVTGWNEAFITDEEDRFCGSVTLNQIVTLERNLDSNETRASEFIEECSLSLTEDMSVLQALEKMEDFVGESIPVLNDNGFIVGVIVESALVRAYLNITHQLRVDENAST